ncbi:Cupredoxin [Gymnopus androsaceus JB14]|uniref:laccase n=1 Tax=Gymnopus androsaceus JB14 TaxID=1447944 RepID=A0A6A4I912_9AGAR|nr:Cupredoxin [Gymnopus androsaceus JB14]
MLLSMVFLIFRLSYLTYGAEVIRERQQHEHLYISNKEIAPDGFRRSTVLAGKTPKTGQFPGPLLTAVKGERLSFNVTDVLTDPTMIRSTSIHWHGLFQKTTNYADGVAFVSQCPIAPNHSFLYDFGVRDQAGMRLAFSESITLLNLPVSTATDYEGLSWFTTNDDPHRHWYDVDDESTVIHTRRLVLIFTVSADIISHGQPSADATLINGKGRYFGGPDVPLAVIEVEHGKHYRFRLISMAFHASHGVSIDGHNLTIIEVDGINTEPHTVNFIKIVRALSSIGVGAYNFTNGVNSGILRYKGAPNVEPTTSPWSDGGTLREADLHPLENPGAPGKPYPGGADVILSGKKHAQDLLPKGSVYTLPRNKVIEINFFGENKTLGAHPFHLHGHAFDVVKTSDSDSFNYVNPVRRDVTLVAFENQTTIRFVTDNPGPWFLHCHMDLHLAVGLAVVLAEDTRDTKQDDPVPADWKSLCPIYDALNPAQLP